MTKKTFIIASFIFFLGGINNTKAQSFEKGKVTISAGYGFGNIGNLIINNIGTYIEASHEVLELTSKSTGPYFGKIEYALNKYIGIGINFVQLSSEANFDVKLLGDSVLYSANISRKGFSITSRMNFHLGGIMEQKSFDPYVGFGIGYRNTQYSFTSSRPDLFKNAGFTDFPLALELTIGAKFMFHKNIGVYSELGFARAIFQVGIVGQF